MLRIKGAARPPAPTVIPEADPEAVNVQPVDQPDEPEVTDQPEEASEPDGDEGMGTKVSQLAVVYMDGEKGPFECSHCCYFQPEASCQIVEGDIDPNGCCNLYCPPNHDESAEPDAEEAVEAPVDEAAEEPVDEEAQA